MLCTVIYQFIAMATITFSKQKGAATKRGRLLYEDGHLSFVECNEKIGPPPKLVQPDQLWQPKLVPLANFGPPSARECKF